MTHEDTTEWIETTNVKQDGTPITRAIRVKEMDKTIYFTTNAYAEVGTDTADLLVNQIDGIEYTSEPDDPGVYYGAAGDHTDIKLTLEDGAVGDLSVGGDLTVHQNTWANTLQTEGDVDAEGNAFVDVASIEGDPDAATSRIVFSAGSTRLQVPDGAGQGEDFDALRTDTGGVVEVPNGDLIDGAGNVVYDQSNRHIPIERVETGQDGASLVAEGTVELTDGSAIVATGEANAAVDVGLDPSGGGVNTENVKVAARAFYHAADDEVKIEILEDGTSVGNPTIGYTVVAR